MLVLFHFHFRLEWHIWYTILFKFFAANLKDNTSLKVVTDSSGGTSPFVFSPCSELSPDILNETRNLPPLELPNFDYLNLIKSNCNNNSN